MSKPETIVLVPAWGMGHLTPMTELAKLFTATTTNFSISIALFDTPYDTSSTLDPFISRVTSSHPSISFHRLPSPSLHLSPSRTHFSFDLLRFSNPQLLHFLASLKKTTEIRALVLDMFCASALDVARHLRIPAYFFFASSLYVLLSFMAVPAIQSRVARSLGEIGDTPLPLHGAPPIPTSYLPAQILLDRDDDVCKAICYHLARLAEADGILVNTFEAMEPRVVEAVRDGLYGPIPPVRCIGPLTSKKGNEEEEEEEHECMKWLDAQPQDSVVFLCFGSMGSFPAEQVREIADGLERSGQRFLWVVKHPVEPVLGEKRVKIGEKGEDLDLEELLPRGFLERTEGRGMVVKLWAPQVAVLGHRAVGGFVSHCGWNSTLEAVTAGVAVIAWPLYAEQKMNKVFLVEEAKVAMEMEGWDDEKEGVRGEEVERKLRWLMESEEGRELKERARAMKERAIKAREEGGSSEKAWTEFVQGLKG